MASRRFRSQRTLAGQVDHLVKRISYIEKNPSPKRLLPRVVTTAKVAPQAITSPKLADNAVTANAIADNAVTTNAIAANAVTNVELAANSVTSVNIVAGSIQVSDIGFTAGDLGASTSILSPTAPVSPNQGDLWFDTSNGNKLSQWNGSAWVSVQDTAIAAAANAATAANNAASAAANVASQANAAANAAQTTANSKNKIIRSTADASGTTGYSAGDLWWKMDSVSATANVIGQWTYDGTKWNSNVLRNEVIGTLDAAKITTGYLAAGRIDANTITSSMIAANAIVAGKIAANAITASVIAANAITASAIAANAVVAGAIAAGAVSATQLTGDAIDGRVITGSIIQSSATTNITRNLLNTSGFYGYKYNAGTLYGSISIEPGANVYAYDGSLGPYPVQSIPAIVMQNSKGGPYSGYSYVISAKGYSSALGDGDDNFIVHLTAQDSTTSPTDAGSMGIQMESRGQYFYIIGSFVSIISDSMAVIAINVNGGTNNLTGNQYMQGIGGYYGTTTGQSSFPAAAAATGRQIGWYSGTITSVTGGLPGDMVFSY